MFMAEQIAELNDLVRRWPRLVTLVAVTALLVASVQSASNDIVRVGDRVEMPQLNADGDVVNIALHTIKIQNWDRTITTVPTKRFISDSFKKWRGMQESGGRRIKRAIFLDQTSVRFLSSDEIKHLGELHLLSA